MDVDEEENLHAQLRKKGKKQTYLIRSNVLELKTRTRRQGKCVGAALEVLEQEKLFRMEMKQTEIPKEYTYISNDIWFHLANYILPEDVKNYALICKQSAYSIKSRRFWMKLYQKYCQHSKDKKKWILELPAQLQMNELQSCDVNILKQRVIQALFYCHRPLTELLKQDYKLDTLWGRQYVSCWHMQSQCVWIMCYKFCYSPAVKYSMETNTSSLEKENVVVQDWESLLEEDSEISFTSSQSKLTNLSSDYYNGVCLLLICCNCFIPFPSDFLYANSASSIRLSSTRELLSKDMRSTNLEMDLISSRGDQGVTWKYNQVLKWKVLPWWHPDFNKFNKCET